MNDITLAVKYCNLYFEKFCSMCAFSVENVAVTGHGVKIVTN